MMLYHDRNLRFQPEVLPLRTADAAKFFRLHKIIIDNFFDDMLT